jgi:hypothetical protein
MDFSIDWKQEKSALPDNELTFVTKHEKLVAKLMFQPNIDKTWKEEFTTYFEGQTKPIKQYLVKGVILDLANKIQIPTILVLKPSHISQIIEIGSNLNEEGIELFHPKSNPVTFTKTGTGMQTRYNVNPLTKPVDCSNYLNWEKSLVDYKNELEQKGTKLNKGEETQLFED